MGNQFEGTHVIDGHREPLGYEQITDVASGSGASLTVPEGARLAFIQPETKDVRWRDDGTDPISTVGMLITANSILSYTGDLHAIRFCQVAATAKLNVSYYA